MTSFLFNLTFWHLLNPDSIFFRDWRHLERREHSYRGAGWHGRREDGQDQSQVEDDDLQQGRRTN